nr:MAG TPA: hypothetical protein [Siphoviridae sp. ctHdl3]
MKLLYRDVLTVFLSRLCRRKMTYFEIGEVNEYDAATL